MTKGRVAGSSLSYPVAQNIASQDLFGGNYDESFTEPKSRTPLERLHKTTIKTEINKDRVNFFFRLLLTQKLIHVYFLILYQVILIIRLVIVVRFFVEMVIAIAVNWQT